MWYSLKKKKYPNYSSRYLKVTITRVNSRIYFSFGEKKQLSPEGEYFSNSKSFSQEGTNIMLNLKKSINRSTLFYSYKAFVKSTHFNKREAMKSGLWRHLFLVVIVVQSLSHVWLFATPWTAARQTPLSFLISQSLFKFMSIESI